MSNACLTYFTASENNYIDFSNLIYSLGSVCNFDVKYCRISSYKRGNGVRRQIGLTFSSESSNTFCPGFANITSVPSPHTIQCWLVHNIQNDLRLLIAIYKVPVVRISLLNSRWNPFRVTYLWVIGLWLRVFPSYFFSCENIQSLVNDT